MWKYSHHHMKLSDTDAAHFSTYELDGTCGYEHVESYECCTILATLFDMSFVSFVNDIVLKQLNDDQYRPEINTVINAEI